MNPATPHAVDALIDTQAVLDWLYFGNPLTAHWEARRQAGHWRWVATPAMRAELAVVLNRGQLPARAGQTTERVLAAFDERAELVEPLRPAQRLRCADPDDQKFIDLAVARPVRWLISRDRALLKLRRRALALHQVEVLTPADWQPAPLARHAATQAG